MSAEHENRQRAAENRNDQFIGTQESYETLDPKS